ncbi:hypothetical protein Skr01_54060 [Sphaerisporangium krabiense]|uniref:Bacterioferritin-associated ferredoxin n=1 Tax=Sphaerisporangium krabiense TaxID=763782 RepID=A0A7W8Z4Y7_9ACTN|nr:(2Fe-2S)-binding protein [Sphaerisporangium krabiense]MBB5627163.1 NAD(P)H-nitrite reductase large subunit [Sphaerisporangium krabiense]GII65321.1 hypothetical protein Skr01_54060 [Sphaerisporangium krabiense]
MTWDDPIVCVCRHVSEDTIVRAIRAGADTLEKVRVTSGANTGCGGCAEEIEELIEDVMSEACAPDLG